MIWQVLLLVFIVNLRIIKKRIDEEKNNCDNEKYFSEKPWQ